MKVLLVMIGIVVAMSQAAQADLAAPPKAKELTVAGTLAWSDPGKTELVLTSVAAAEDIKLGKTADMPKSVNWDELIGKQVEARIKVTPRGGRNDKNIYHVKKVIGVREVSPVNT